MDNPFESSDEIPQQGATPSTPALTVQPSEQVSSVEPSSVVTARGTADGLVLRVDARIESVKLLDTVSTFVENRRAFLAGNEVALEWVGAKPSDSIVQDLCERLRENFDIVVKASKLKPQIIKTDLPRPTADEPEVTGPSLSVVSGTKGSAAARSGAEAPTARNSSTEARATSLFDGLSGTDEKSRGSALFGLSWDEPDARILYTTLRSGQKVETEHSVVVLGDVNSGAEVIAGGDIIVLGTLRGIAHAGAYDETGGGRIIVCLNMQPTQLRIGTVISRGVAEERSSGDGPRGPEIARVQSNLIVVEPYQARGAWGRRRE
jgi:septum formation inhibitor MinC